VKDGGKEGRREGRISREEKKDIKGGRTDIK
jgi:hypothetical protein